MDAFVSASIDRFTGFGRHYDAFRPAAPAVIPELLSRYARTPVPAMVVDLGCGTGLSTRVWASRASRVVGVEPNDDMRGQAEQASAGLHGISFRSGISTATGLPDGCADIVTCSQCLHWMEPAPTFAEIARLLRSGGVFCAYDYDLAPAVDWEVENAFARLRERIKELEQRNGLKEPHKWDKAGHLARMAESGRFRFTREVRLHSLESGSPERLVGLIMSLSGVRALLSKGVSETDLGLDEFRAIAARVLGPGTTPLVFGYTVRIAVK